ncbi:MAG: hypothetical protein EOM12_17625, partial [Verrucomicrobiae bacterium]|nr:hypothetical protein [Verrucomicrobiae bacterium]
KRFSGVPIFEDVRKLTAEVIRDRTGMGTSQSIDIIFGGFPCQDLSQAGKQVGLTGARSGLWFEMLRVISELRPRYVVAENVRGAVNLALDTVYSNLVNEGYKVYPYVIPASAVGAPHQRERLFVVGVREDVHMRYTEAMENPGCELRQRGSEQREMGRETSEGIASDSEFSGGTLWPSPVASDGSCGGIISPDDTYVQKESGLFRKINRNGTDGSVGLARMVKLWPTPSARDYKDSPGQKSIDTPRPNEGSILPVAVYREAAKLWPTPTGTERSGINPITGSGAGLSKTVRLWPTPRQFMYKDSTTDRNKGNIGEKVGGQLNPDWVEQLMNFPEGWTALDVDEPKPWQGWPALLGQDILWATPNCMDTLPSRSYEAMKKQALNGARKNRSKPGNLREQIDPVMCKAYEDASHENGGNVKAIEVHSQYPYEFPRTTTGCKNRAKRLKALGNAVVPAQAYPFFRAIVEIEKIIKREVIL